MNENLMDDYYDKRNAHMKTIKAAVDILPDFGCAYCDSPDLSIQGFTKGHDRAEIYCRACKGVDAVKINLRQLINAIYCIGAA